VNKHSAENPLLPSCRRASELASAAVDRELTRRERWALRFHTLLCSACRRFAAQMRLIHQLFADISDSRRQRLQIRTLRLPRQSRQRIKQLLWEEGNRPPQK
jgi:hypothetical protein